MVRWRDDRGDIAAQHALPRFGFLHRVQIVAQNLPLVGAEIANTPLHRRIVKLAHQLGVQACERCHVEPWTAGRKGLKLEVGGERLLAGIDLARLRSTELGEIGEQRQRLDAAFCGHVVERG